MNVCMLYDADSVVSKDERERGYDNVGGLIESGLKCPGKHVLTKFTVESNDPEDDEFFCNNPPP